VGKCDRCDLLSNLWLALATNIDRFVGTTKAWITKWGIVFEDQ